MKNNYAKLFLLLILSLCLILTNTCKKLEKVMLVSTGEISSILPNSAEASGMVIDVGEGATQHGHCFATTPNATISGTKTQLGIPAGNGGFTSQLTGLEAGTKYYVKAYLSNGTETVYGKEVNFTTNSASLPDLTTIASSSITTTSAVSGGNINSDGGTPVTTRGVCWSTSMNPTTIDSKTSDGSGTGSFASNLTGLTPEITYYIRAYATNDVGTSYGNELSFTTEAVSIPSISTTSISEVTQSSATSGGNISSNGGAAVIARGVCWNTAPNPTTTNSKTSDGTGTGSFISNLIGLTASTEYWVRAYATNSEGTGYGNEVSFTTNAVTIVVPTLSTTDITAITTTTAKSGGDITSDGGSPVTVRGVCWGTNTSPTIGNGQETSNGSGSGTFVSNITGLSPGTIYYARAYATNSVGTSYGNELSFTTSAVTVVVPTLITVAITAITQTSATSGGDITSDGGATITERGVCWSTFPTPLVSGSHTSDGTTSGIYTSSITGLTESTTYYVRAFATNSAGTAYGQEESFTTSATLVTGSFTDSRDGNDYNWVQVGTKKWMSENLAYLPLVSPSDQSSYYDPHYYVYGYQSNDVGSAKATSNYSTYGVLYNWKAAMGGASSNNDNPGALQGVCPDGWHLPSDNEWKELEVFLGMTSTDADQTGSRGDIGGILKEEGTTHWSSPNNGATNSSGFTALPGGKRNYDNSFFAMTADGYWWSSTEYNVTYAYNRIVDYAFLGVNRNYPNKDQGLSVRCVEGQGILVPTVETSTTVSSITISGAVTGGTVTGNGGSPVTARGVCWNTSTNPVIGNGKETVDGTGIGNYTSTITGLTASTQYYFRAYAINSAGTAYGSEQSFTTIASTTTPDPPIIGTATAGNAQATVSFTAPADDGGSAITGYTVTSSPDGFTGTGVASPITVTGLNNGTAYTFTVTATNAIGTGPASFASNSVTPSTVPDAPTGVSATAGNAQATVTFTVPASDGGAVITGYTVTSSPSGFIGNGTTSPVIVGGLTNGIAYTFTVIATNDNGNSAASVASNSVTPSTVPDAPTIGTATAGNALATVTFTAPAKDGGSVITGYTVTSSPSGFIGNGTTSPVIVGGLTNGTAYTFTVTATNAIGTSAASASSNSVTPLTVPTLTTTAISSITSTTATSGGNITSDGGASVTDRGVCWSTIANPTTSDSKTSDGTGTGPYASSITGLTPETIYYVRGYATNSAGTTYGNQVSFTTSTLLIGDSYQGGIVAYILQSGDPGYITGQTHGLIATEGDLSGYANWGCFDIYIIGADESALGTGAQNTIDIITSCTQIGIAAKRCNDLVLNGYSDWYLPSKDELDKLYINRNIIGGFTNNVYLSSTEFDTLKAWGQNFLSGVQDIFWKGNNFYGRATRSF